MRQSPAHLVNMIKYWNKTYYEEHIKKYTSGLTKPQRINIDWTSDFDFNNIREGSYCHADGSLDTTRIINDLQKCMLVISGQNTWYITKEWDELNKCYYPMWGNRKMIHEFLSDIRFTYTETEKDKQVKKSITLWDVYDKSENKTLFIRKGSRFYSTDKDVFSNFIGYTHQQLDEVDMDVIEPYLKLVKDVIANHDEKLAKRIHQWVAYPLQHPGERNGVALVIIGEEGTGKTEDR